MPLVQSFISLNLPNDCLLFGSGPLYYHGIKQGPIRDLDFILGERAWGVARLRYATMKPKSGIGHVITIMTKYGTIELFQRWNIEHLTNDILFKEGRKTTCGFMVATLSHVREYKSILKRGKDIKDIKEIDEYLSNLKVVR